MQKQKNPEKIDPINDMIKKKLTESLMMNDTIETDELTRRVQEVEDYEKAAGLTQECESIIIRTKEKGIIRIAYVKARFLKSLRTRIGLSH